MGKRILVTGCGGFVGGSIVHQAPDGIEIHAVTRKEPLLKRDGLVWHSLDLCNQTGLREMFDAASPDAVIHAAAIADIDFCEANRDTAWRVNVTVTQQLAGLCRERGVRFVYISTDNVFDGEKGAYTEDDAPNPINYYAETKAAGERAAEAMEDNYVVARTAVVMGFPMLGAGNSFLSRMLTLWREGKRVGVPENEIRTPIDVVTLARALLELADAPLDGRIHLAGNECLNRYETARRLAWLLGFSQDLVYPNNPETIPGRAPRPLNVSLSNNKARNSLSTPMTNLEGGLQLVLDTLPRPL